MKDYKDKPFCFGITFNDKVFTITLGMCIKKVHRVHLDFMLSTKVVKTGLVHDG